MGSPLASLAVLETGLAVLFFTLLIRMRREVPACDAALWTVAWASRVFCAVNGVLHLSPGSTELKIYLTLQCVSALALAGALCRSECRVLRQRLLRALLLRAGVEQHQHAAQSVPD